MFCLLEKDFCTSEKNFTFSREENFAQSIKRVSGLYFGILGSRFVSQIHMPMGKSRQLAYGLYYRKEH